MDESIDIGLILDSRSMTNASDIAADLGWLSSMIDIRMNELLNRENEKTPGENKCFSGHKMFDNNVFGKIHYIVNNRFVLSDSHYKV
jgi:hypothetical protein